MTELDQLIERAYKNEGKQEDVNKVYLRFLQALLFLPVKKDHQSDEPFSPVFANVDDHYFVQAFDQLERLQNWAGDFFSKMNYVEISGKDLVAGLNEQVYLCLNYGTEFYKEFSPDEVKKLKMIVARIDQMKTP